MSKVKAQQLFIPSTVLFDDLLRHFDHYSNFSADNEFLEFITNQIDCRKKWQDAEEECRRLQTQLENTQLEQARQDRKIQETRSHLAVKLECVNKLEKEKERLDFRISASKTLLKSFLEDPRSSIEVKDRLSTILSCLDNPESLKKQSKPELRSQGYALDTISEGDSTDLSFTQSEDGLDVSNTRRKPKRPSLDYPDAKKGENLTKKTRFSGEFKDDNYSATSSPRSHTLEFHTNDDKIKSSTKIKGPNSNGIYKVQTKVETQSSTNNKQPPPPYYPSAPKVLMTVTESSESESVSSGWSSKDNKIKTELNTLANSAVNISSPMTRTLSSSEKIASRHHSFVEKTVVRMEMCTVCEKRIKFSKTALKCRDCNTTCHLECRDKVGQCISVRTPNKKVSKQNFMGTIADYAPIEHPMIPGLLLHCIHEIEKRGLDQKGIYRVPGSEKEVKDLKDKLLNKRKVVNLKNYDVNVLCGCVKDFLRTIQEPLIGRWFWKDFTLAADLKDPIKKEMEFDRIIRDLPIPNQETLAFMMLHLRRVAQTPEVCMNKENLVKVFGPTIVGYSNPDKDLDRDTILEETTKQHMVVDALLSFSEDFWNKFIYKIEEKGNIFSSRTNKRLSKQLSNAVTVGSPQKSKNKIAYFTDDSPTEPTPRRAPRKYFD